MPDDIPRITLDNGVEMPVLGFGVYQIPAEQTERAVTDALAAGYRSLDTAAAYRNEEAVVLRWLIQRGVVVIPKSVRVEHMRENIDVFDFELSDEQMTRIGGGANAWAR